VSTVKITLERGWKIGDTTHNEVELREPHAGDIIAASEAAERVVHTAGGPVLVQSPARAEVEILKRQIVRVGDLKDVEITEAMWAGLSPADFEKIRSEGDQMVRTVQEALEARGRVDQGGAAD